MRLLHAFFLFFGLAAGSSLYGQTDTLRLNNGDYIVGDVKTLKNGVLTVETDYSDSDFKIEWEKVVFFKSPKPFVIRYIGSEYVTARVVMDPGDSSMVILALEFGSTVNVPLQDIVDMSEVGGGWIDRMKADIAAGINLTKANNLRQFNLTANVGYYTNKWSINGSGNSIFSRQDDVDPTRRTDASVGGNLYLKRAWFASLGTSFLSNDEINLSYRVINGASFGKNFFQTNSWYWNVKVGIANTQEEFTGAEATVKNSWEGVLSTELNLFDIGDLDFLFKFTGYPSLTEEGRFRYDASSSLKYDLPLDFFIKFSTTLNFDNQPSGGAESLDYVFQTTFGWEL